MSYKATNWAYDLPLIGSQKFVIVALADMADEQNSCFPGQGRLAEMTGRSVETVRRALKGLEARGLIRRERRIGSYGFRTSDRYWLSVGMSIPEVLPVKMPTRRNAHKATGQFLPVILSTPTGHGEAAIEALENHQKNHQGKTAPEPQCKKHLNDTDPPDCGACKRARLKREAWMTEHAKPSVPPIKADATCDHFRPVGTYCDICDGLAVAS